MSEKFDPYHKWLGIPAEEQPPNHYRLLGVGLFEDDPDVIEGAADRQMAHVQTHKTGPHSALSQKVLNELAAAKLCLLNAKKRADYDANLRNKLPAAVPQASLPVAMPITAEADVASAMDFSTPAVEGVVVSKRAPSSTSYLRARKNAQRVQLAIGGLVLATLLGVVCFIYFTRETQPVAAAGNGGLSPAVPVAVTPQPITPRPATRPNVTPGPADQSQNNSTTQPGQSGNTNVPRQNDKPPKPITADPPSDSSTDSAANPTPPKPNTNKPPTTPTTVPKPATPDRDVPGDLSDNLTGPKQKRPAPEEAALNAARQEVETAFASELSAARTADARVELANTLFEQGIDPKNELVSRYVLLEQSRELAAAGGDAELALRSVDELAKQFLVDGLQLKLDAVVTASKVTRPAEEKQSLAESLLALVSEALDAERFDEAGRLADLAKSEAIKAGDPDLRSQAEEQDKLVTRLAKAHQAVQSAELALEANPEDPEAHLALGKYHCLVRDDWETGLGHLLLGSDADFKELAELEQTASEEAEAQVTIADGWWDLAARHAGADKAALQARARHWYEQALPGLPPLKKKTVEQRLERETEAVAQTPKSEPSLLMKKVKKAISDKRLLRTATVGQISGDAFEALPSDGGLLVGIKYTLRGRGTTQTINSVQPIFLTPDGETEEGKVYGRSTGVVYEVRAREGYAIGGIAVRGTTRVNGFGVVFIKLGGNSLNKREKYNGDWQGAPGASQDLGAFGKPVVGLLGALGANSGELEALGLIQTP